MKTIRNFFYLAYITFSQTFLNKFFDVAILKNPRMVHQNFAKGWERLIFFKDGRSGRRLETLVRTEFICITLSHARR